MASRRNLVSLEDAEHVTVYHRGDEYAGWPFNGGVWSFGEGEILVGFNRNKCAYASPRDVEHSRVQLGAGQLVTLRSKDGGRTWPVEGLRVVVGSKAELRAKVLHYPPADSPLPKPRPVDFSKPGSALAVETLEGRRLVGLIFAGVQL